MKILCFIDSLGSGGAQRQIVGLAVLLKQKGYEVKVCTYYKNEFYKPYLDENDVSYEIIPNAANTKTRIWAVTQYFKREEPDWVIAYQETPSLVACAARLLGCKFKLLVSERNTTQKVGWNERVRFMLYHLADAIVPNSYSQEKWLIQHHPWMKDKITTITNFVDLEKFHHLEHSRHGIPEIVVAASIWESKNTLGLIKALAILKKRNVKCHVFWYGKSELNIGYFYKSLDLIKEFRLEEYIDLLPKTNNIINVYQQADYFCLPSLYEGTPNVLCEAIACGLPAIVSDVCDNRRYVDDGKNGVLFNPNEPSDIADKIASFISQTEDEYNICCYNSRKKAETTLSETSFINKYIQIIES